MKEKKLKLALDKLSNELVGVMENVEKSTKNNKTIEEMQLEMMKQQSTILIRHIMKRCVESESLCEDVLQEHKSWERCMKYVTKKAKVFAVNSVGGMVACIPRETVFEWAEDYFRADDLAEVKEELEKLEKQKAEREAKAKADAEKEALAREKAIEKLSAEEGWDELPEEEKEKKITAEARNIKYSLGKSKTSNSKKTKKTAKKGKEEKEEVKEEAVIDEADVPNTSTDETSSLSNSEEMAPMDNIVPFEEKDKTMQMPEDDGEQMDIFSMLSV